MGSSYATSYDRDVERLAVRWRFMTISRLSTTCRNPTVLDSRAIAGSKFRKRRDNHVRDRRSSNNQSDRLQLLRVPQVDDRQRRGKPRTSHVRFSALVLVDNGPRFVECSFLPLSWRGFDLAFWTRPRWLARHNCPNSVLLSVVNELEIESISALSLHVFIHFSFQPFSNSMHFYS